MPYAVVSFDADAAAASDGFSLGPAPRAGDALRILLTSDHQVSPNVAANLAKAHRTAGPFDAVLFAGDLVEMPERASDWFDDARGRAFFPLLQGRGAARDGSAPRWRGAPIVQHAPLFPAIGNHDVQGRVDGAASLRAAIGRAVPRRVADAACPPELAGDERDEWIERHSFSTRTYREMFTLPEGAPRRGEWYAATIGDVRLVTLFGTRIWRGYDADPEPVTRARGGRWQEAADTLDDPFAQGHGSHVFASLEPGSDQHAWLLDELASPAFRAARWRVIMLHEGPHGLGENATPPFTDPVRIEERASDGRIVGVRYEYPRGTDQLQALVPLWDDAGVDLVFSGHSHLFNRFVSPAGMHLLETANVGNTHGAFWPGSGRRRILPPAPWDPRDYAATGDPAGLSPVAPTVAPVADAAGAPSPYVSSPDVTVFSVLDTEAGEVVSWAFDVRTPEREPWIIDRFALRGGQRLG